MPVSRFSITIATARERMLRPAPSWPTQGKKLSQLALTQSLFLPFFPSCPSFPPYSHALLFPGCDLSFLLKDTEIFSHWDDKHKSYPPPPSTPRHAPPKQLLLLLSTRQKTKQNKCVLNAVVVVVYCVCQHQLSLHCRSSNICEFITQATNHTPPLPHSPPSSLTQKWSLKYL